MGTGWEGRRRTGGEVITVLIREVGDGIWD
jgi:hypothetical protein